MDELRIAEGPIELALLPEVGGRLHRLRVFGHDLLRTPADPEEHWRDPFFWGGYVMAPWCNRIEPTPVSLGTRRIALEPNFPDGSAIHGQVYARRWEVEDGGALVVHAGGDGWPWQYEVRMEVAIAGSTLRIVLDLRNLASDPMPAGLGIHPWFLRPIRVAIRGDAVYPSNTAAHPRPEPVNGPLDLRRLGVMADDLDATWGELAEPPVELVWPDAALEATIRFTAPTRFVVAASPAALDAIALEPETHAPQGLRLLRDSEPGGLTLLDPGDALRLGIELAFARREER